MDSLSKQQYDLLYFLNIYAPPLLICPKAKFKNKEEAFRLIQLGEFPIDSTAAYDKSSSSSSSSSSPSHIRRLEEIIREGNSYTCRVCKRGIHDTALYTCKECENGSEYEGDGYHKKCVEPILNHPYHPNHFLHVRWCLDYIGNSICIYCSDYKIYFYSCSICIFNICISCAKKPPILEIYHQKRHKHTLFYFPRLDSLTCDICALDYQRSFKYVCHQCNFVVHKDCVYFPCILKISRHEHRLSFNSSLSSEKWLCGVCRGKICTHYGRYSCMMGCSYGVHSKCATRKDVWDGEALEGVPEDVKSLNEISDGVIQHFSHENHHMRLNNSEFGKNKQRCQACALPISDDIIIYSCMQCGDFILHQECAYLPRKKQHAAHPHPLSLQVKHRHGFFKCYACERKSNGFGYSCGDKLDCEFILDVCCASIAVPLDRQCHPHPLFLIDEAHILQHCSICQSLHRMCLNCGDCEFALCFGCATLPEKMRYKLDDHLLIFSYGKAANGQYLLCDECEKEIDPTKGIYVCNNCKATLHTQCLLGKDMYIMLGEDIHLIFKKKKKISIFLDILLRFFPILILLATYARGARIGVKEK